MVNEYKKVKFFHNEQELINLNDHMDYIMEIIFAKKLMINENKIIKKVHIVKNQMIIIYDQIIAHIFKEVKKIEEM